MLFECHITVPAAQAEAAEKIATAMHWKTSQIAGDPVLGKATFFYLTTHGTNLISVQTRMQECFTELRLHHVTVLRQKIEIVIYDTRNGIFG